MGPHLDEEKAAAGRGKEVLRVSVRQMLALLLAVCLLLAAAAAVIFQDNITKFNLRPRTPYQTYTPPPPPAYAARGAWAVWPDDKDAGLADIFYIHSTTYSGRGNWNAPVTADTANRTLRRVAAPNQAGPFMSAGAVYGPRYRQATLFASFTHKFEGRGAYALAYRDIEKAFSHFLAEREPDRPIILVGYGQGGLHVLGLLQYHFAENEELRRHLAAAYVIGQSAPTSLFKGPLKQIPPCRSPDDVRCVISYIDLEEGFEDEERRHRARALIWAEDRKELVSFSGAPPLCVNPLSWTVTEERKGPETHVGAASATGLRLGETPPTIARAISAECEDGILMVTAPRQNFLRRKRWFGDHWRPQDFNLFFHDLTADAKRRAQNVTGLLEYEAQFLDPIAETVELEPSPVNKVPD